jgi:hypothetical protein
MIVRYTGKLLYRRREQGYDYEVRLGSLPARDFACFSVFNEQSLDALDTLMRELPEDAQPALRFGFLPFGTCLAVRVERIGEHLLSSRTIFLAREDGVLKTRKGTGDMRFEIIDGRLLFERNDQPPLGKELVLEVYTQPSMDMDELLDQPDWERTLESVPVTLHLAESIGQVRDLLTSFPTGTLIEVVGRLNGREIGRGLYQKPGGLIIGSEEGALQDLLYPVLSGVASRAPTRGMGTFWGEVQTSRRLLDGVYHAVTTKRQELILVDVAVARETLTPQGRVRGTTVGNWSCYEHRSYAMALPLFEHPEWGESLSISERRMTDFSQQESQYYRYIDDLLNSARREQED